jgi:hypothetical protein
MSFWPNGSGVWHAMSLLSAAFSRNQTDQCKLQNANWQHRPREPFNLQFAFCNSSRTGKKSGDIN